DEILAVEDSSRGVSLQQLTPSSVADFVRERGGKSIEITYLHENATTSASVIPAHAVIPDSAGTPALGIALVLVSSHPLAWGQAFREAFPLTKKAFVSVGGGLRTLASRALHGEPSISQVI